MNTDLPPEVMEQVRALADYARHNRYAQITIAPPRKAYFKREGFPLLTKEGWENKWLAALRVLAILWMLAIMLWAFFLVGTSLIVPFLSLDFSWAIILLASPWLCIQVANTALFTEGPEAKSMINLALFVGTLLIGVGSLSKIQPVTIFLYAMGLPCLALSFLGDLRSAIAWMQRRRKKTGLAR